MVITGTDGNIFLRAPSSSTEATTTEFLDQFYPFLITAFYSYLWHLYSTLTYLWNEWLQLCNIDCGKSIQMLIQGLEKYQPLHAFLLSRKVWCQFCLFVNSKEILSAFNIVFSSNIV